MRHRLIAGRGDRFPVYDRSGKRYRYRRDEPGFGHDTHDVDPRLHHLGRRRVEGAGRHGIRPDYRRRGLYGAFHGGRFHYRLKDRLLAGEHTRQARDLEILRHTSFCRYGRRRDLDIEPDVRFHAGQLAAPQANAMAAVIEPLMSGSGAPWALYAIGAVLAVVLNFCKIPALAFALGMFIPLDLIRRF